MLGYKRERQRGGENIALVREICDDAFSRVRKRPCFDGTVNTAGEDNTVAVGPVAEDGVREDHGSDGFAMADENNA